MDGVLNETTNTVHKREKGRSALHTVCGVTYNVPEDNLRPDALDPLITATDTTKCGRCFEDAGGY